MPARLRTGLQALSVAAVAGLLALLVWKIVHDEKGSAAADLARGGRPAAPAFALPRLDRPGTLELASLRGKAVVLNFWASWCIPCKAEAPRLEAAWREWRGRGVVVVGVDAQDFSSDARRFMRRHRITYPIVHDGPGRTLGRYGVVGFPETFFVDRQGRLVGKRIQGEVSEEDLREGIGLALASQ